MEKYELDHLKKLLIEGLTTDGCHHKQWYLERTLLFLIGLKEFDEAWIKYDWEKGIPD